MPDRMSGSGLVSAALTQRLSGFAEHGDSEQVLTACQELVEHAKATAQVPTVAAARELLTLLRGRQRFETLSVLADALIRMGREEPIVLRLYAQGLTDQGLSIAAREVLRGLARDVTSDPAEHSEVRGLMGHINKQIYVDAHGRPSDQARRALRQAIGCYRGGL